MKKGKLIIFSAPSGSGKTTIVKHLLSQGLGLEFSVSATSRKPRGTEVNGKEYYFITADEFRKKVENNEFLEWEEVYANNYYGTLKSEVERIRNEGKTVVFDVDVVGGCNIKKYYGNEALSVFIQPPSVVDLEKRLKARSTDSDEVIRTRVEKAAHELTYVPQFDVVIVNDILVEAQKKAEEIVREFINS
jgi:guanylate kinase